MVPSKPIQTYGPCATTPGVCQDIANYCAHTYVSFECPMGSNIRCCPSGAGAAPPNIVQPGGSANPSMCKGLIFPLATGSLQHISVNWGGERNNGARCHAGIYLFSQGAKKVIAIADGVVTGVIANFLTCTCTGSNVVGGAVMVYHPSIDQTVNYGEITASSILVTQGQSVTQGEHLGTAGACCMLHFELYAGRQWPNLHWYPANGHVATNPDGCTHTSLSTKPAGILDPRPLINCLKPPGASLLTDAGVGSEQAVFEIPTPPTSTHAKQTISGGLIALIVIVGVLVVACIGVVVVCFLRQHRNKDGAPVVATDLVVRNALFDAEAGSSNKTMRAQTLGGMMTMRNDSDAVLPNETFELRKQTVASRSGTVSAGTYQCGKCSSVYSNADDLAQHIAKRHAS